MERRVSGTAEMDRFAAEFIAALSPAGESAATVLALSGELGVGKTTFTQHVAKALGVADTVNSPTFVIEKIYQLPLDSARGENKFSRLVHIDAYRLKGAEELKHLGWDEIIADSSNLIIIEWPEHVGEAIPENAHRIRIAGGEGDARTITYDS
mgnify:CR=1 FL=1